MPANVAAAPRRLAPSSLRERVASNVTRLAIEVGDDGKLPTEFRLFCAGWNSTTKGRFLFDDEAAAATMAAFEKWGVDLMIDLEHQSLDEVPSADPTARDARGWCELELRDGELWAVNVRWTDDGAARLKKKTQRYVSPTFTYDKKTCRVEAMHNVALVAMPATHDAPALVAASARDLRRKKLSAGPTFADVQRALYEALAERFGTSSSDPYAMGGPFILDVFDASVVFERDGKLYEIAYAFGGEAVTLGASEIEVRRTYEPVAPAPPAAPPENAPPAPEAPPPPATAPATPAALKNRTASAKLAAGGPTDMDRKTAQDALDILEKKDGKGALEMVKRMLASSFGGEPAPEEAAPEEEAPAPEEGEGEAAASTTKDDDKKDGVVTAGRFASALTGVEDENEAIAELTRRSAMALGVEEREQQLAADRAKVETNERRALVGKLVKLGVELPATAWSDDKGSVPVARLANEPIASLRDRVALLQKNAPPAKLGGGPTPPKKPGTDAHGLTESQLEHCRVTGCEPAVFAKLHAQRNPPAS